ncbi:MAG: thiamine pyrophosphate-binding protein [Sinimarinibacterium sp.]|jgi:benzoylformate decarboxylase
MRAGDVLMQSLLNHGVSCIFGNPGTTENAILDRLIDTPQCTYYMTLHEGVAVGAATFYALATGKTGVVNLHVAPGLGNAIGLIFGALKANAPLVITAGQQDTRMRERKTMFSHDLVGMAAPVTKWSTEPRSGDEVGPAMQRAFEIANEPPFGPVFVSLPVDVMEQEASKLARPRDNVQSRPDSGSINVEPLVEMLLQTRSPAIVVGDDVAATRAVGALVRLAETVGACVYRESVHAQCAFPTDHHCFRGRLPFDARSISTALAGHDLILLVGGQFFEELWFEATQPLPETARVARIELSSAQLAASYPIDVGIAGDISAIVERLLDRLSIQGTQRDREAAGRRNQEVLEAGQRLRRDIHERLQSVPETSPMSPMQAMYTLSQALPSNVVVADESLTAGFMDFSASNDAIAKGAIYTSLEFGFALQGQGSYFSGRGGGLGQAMAGAIGLQIANPDRPVVAFIGDGSAMYSVQSLWTAAHYHLPIIFIVFSNREYRVLKHNLDIYRHRFGIDPSRPYPHMDLSEPLLSYPAIAKGMGVEGESVTTADQLSKAITKALRLKQPYLIEMEITGKASRPAA